MNRFITGLGVLFCIVQAVLLITQGIYTQEEALKYSYEANYFIENGVFSQPKYIFYSGYIFLHVLAQLGSAGNVAVYAVQLLLNAFATYCFYRMVIMVSKQNLTAFVATLLLIVCLPFQKWTSFLYTESVFFSLITILCWLLLSRRIALAMVVLCLVIVTRPTGLLVAPACLAWATYTLWSRGKKWWAFIIWLPGIATVMALLDTAMKGKGEFDFMLPLVQEHIICGLPTVDNNSAYGDGGSMRSMMSYIVEHPGKFSMLAFKRLMAFFGMMRPYYSGTHNILLAMCFYPVYIFAVLGLRDIYKNSKGYFIFSMVLILTFAASVTFTCDDWHNRFIMPVMPFILVFAAVGSLRFFNFQKLRGGRGIEDPYNT